MSQQAVMTQLRSYFPEFWTKTLQETTFIDKLLDIYSMWYASAYAQISQVENAFSIKKIDSYAYDYYFTVDCTDNNRFVPTERVRYHKNTFKLPSGVFYLEALSYDSYFSRSVKDYLILYDQKQNQYFVALSDTDYQQEKTLFARVVHSSDISYPFKYFFNFQPIIFNKTEWSLVGGTTVIYQVPLMYEELDYIKAQYTNMMYTLTNGGTYDALDSLFGVAFRRVYSKLDGTILDFDTINVWIDHSGLVVHYVVESLKPKFQVVGAPVRQYECLEPSDIELLSWQVNPAKFAQVLIGDHAKVLRSLVGLQSNEKENSLVVNNGAASWDFNTNYDLGGHLWKDQIGHGLDRGRKYGANEPILTSDWKRRTEFYYSDLDYWDAFQGPRSYIWQPDQAKNTPNQRFWKEHFEPFIVSFGEKGEKMVLHRYDYWTDIRFDSNVPYEMFKNVIVWQTQLRTEWHGWIQRVLNFFRPLHLKYVPSPMNGIAPQYRKGFGVAAGRHYGGFRTVTKGGYGFVRGRNSFQGIVEV